MAFIGIRISDKSKSGIKALAKDLDKTVSEITRQLLEELLKEQNDKIDMKK